jgi:putative DNA methylase
LIDAIRDIPEEEYRHAFVTIFSNSLEYNNMMTPYNYPHRKLHHLFNYHAMPLTTTPVENAVWGMGKQGTGTFANCYQRYVRAKGYCHEPFDRFKDSCGVIRTVCSKTENISAQFVSSFKALKETPKGAWLICGDSSDLSSVPDNSVDFVITDPPYFDSIHYSELSNFFYVWLKSLVNHPCFDAEHVPTEQEAIGNIGMDKGEKEYQALLASVFKEGKRVLKHEGKLIFTFHHTQ